MTITVSKIRRLRARLKAITVYPTRPYLVHLYDDLINDPNPDVRTAGVKLRFDEWMRREGQH